MASEAVWIPAPKTNVHLDTNTETAKPGPQQVLVETACISFNPIDSKIQKCVTSLHPESQHQTHS